MANAAAAQSGWDISDDEHAVLDALEAYGCTLGDTSAGALLAGGTVFDVLQQTALKAQAVGLAEPHGGYVVFDDDICTIRIPHIESRWSPSDLEIQTAAPFIRDAYSLGDTTIVDEGCFLDSPPSFFTLMNGGDEDKGFSDNIAFTAAGIISGEARYYSNSPLMAPRGLQIMVGEGCRTGANIADIDATHSVISEGFGQFVRAAFEANTCGDGRFAAPNDVIAALQVVHGDGQSPANAALQLEWMFITLAAGWHDGASANERGTPRPPLCHYE